MPTSVPALCAAIVLTTLLSLPASAEAGAPGNLLANGGIDGLASWSHTGGGEGVRFFLDEEAGAAAPGSLCIDKPDGGSSPDNWTQGVPAPQEKPCRIELTAMVKAEGLAGGAEACVMLQCWGERTQAENYAWSDRIRADCDWKRVRAVFEVPAATRNVRVRAYLTGQGKVWFDDLRMVVTDAELTEAPAAAPPAEGRMEQLVRGCAGEVPWRFDTAAAVEEATRAKLPLLVYVRCTDAEAGLTSARESIEAPAIPLTDDGMRKDILFRCGPFADADVQAMATERFVPVVVTYVLSSSGRGFGPESGAGDPLAFLGLECKDVVTPALIAATPKGKPMGKLHRLGALSADLVDLWMRGMLERAGARRQADTTGDDEAAQLADTHRLLREGELDRAFAALDGLDSPAASLERARIQMRRGAWAPALSDCEAGLAFEGDAAATGELREELSFWRAWCLFLVDREEEAATAWRELAGESRIGRKAAACCLDRGPRLWLSETARLWPRERKLPEQSEGGDSGDLDPGRCVLALLELQLPDGAFVDHNAFARGSGATSLVTPALTALAAQAMRAWESELPEPLAQRARAARELADRFLAGYARNAPPGGDVFASPYVLEELLLAGEREAAEHMVARIAGQQLDTGCWTVYTPDRPASFNTALALLALVHARDAGLEVPAATIEKGTGALAAMRQEGGLFPYSTKTGHEWMTTPHGSIARDPLCEHALLALGAGSKKTLAAALARYLEFHQELRAPTKQLYDYFNMRGHGGYYFYFAHLNAVRAAGLSTAAARRKVHAAARAAVLASREGDGTFLDQVMMGRAYGTAAALVILAETRE